MQRDIRQDISASLARINDDYARMVKDRMTIIEQYPTPFLQHSSIYRIEHMNPRKPVVFYLGLTPERQAYLLTDQAENFVRLAQADGVSIHAPETATSYATAYLHATRSMSRLTYLVEAASNISFRPHLTDEQTSSMHAFLSKYQAIITPPSARSEGESYVVNAFVVQEQTLLQYSIKVDKNGGITTEVAILEQNLPLVYGL